MIAFLPMLINLFSYKKLYMKFTGLIIPSLIIFLILPSITGCGGKVILTEEAVRTRKIYDFVYELKDLYEQHDEQILSKFSQEYIKDASWIREGVLEDFKRFKTISMSIFIDRIETFKENVHISIHWNGTWKDDKKTYIEGGSVVLLISNDGDTIQITGLKGDSPFGISKKFNSSEP